MRSGTIVVFAMALAGCSLYFPRDGNEPLDARPVTDGTVPDAPIDFGAACKAPEGAAIALDPSRVPAALAGRWWICGGAAEFYGHVEFTADLQFYMLTQMGNQFVRNLGPGTSGTYSVDPTPPGISFSIHQYFPDGHGATYPLQGHIMERPRKLLLGGGYYVAIP